MKKASLMKFQIHILPLLYLINTILLQKKFVGLIMVKITILMLIFQVKAVLEGKFFKKLQKFHMGKLEPINKLQKSLIPKLTGQLELRLAEIRFQ